MLLITSIVVAILLLLPLVLRPAMTKMRGGRLFALAAIIVVPVGAGFAGLNAHMEGAKTTAFCTSCHVMERYGQSLHIDDLDHIPAKHFQFNRVPRDTACYTCHTSYTMFGDYKSKFRGLRHLYIQYIGTIPKKIELYSPYENRECLHCHEGARSFVESVTHSSEPGRLSSIRNGATSCLTKGCHDTTHDAEKVASFPKWPPDGEVKP